MSRRRETPLDAAEKHCSHCDSMLPIRMFGQKRRGSSVYYQSWCKICRAADEQARRINRSRLLGTPLHAG